MIWATVSSWSCFCWLYRASPFCLERIQSIWFRCLPSGDVRVKRLLLCCWKRVFAMTSAFSWQNSISFCPALFHTPRPNLPVTPRCFLTSYFAFKSPLMKRTFGVLVLKGLIGLHRTIQLQLLQHYWLGHRLELLWYWMVCLGNEQRSLCHFWDCFHVLHFKLLLTMMATYSISSKELLPTVVNTMVIWIKLTHSTPFYLTDS